MTLSYRNGISIAEIIIYVPCLAIAVFLAFRHGFGRNAGWLFLIMFCLARIIGPCMSLATISQPTNISLYTGAAILQNIGLSPLQLCTIGLLSRLLDNINKSTHTFINTRMLKFIETIIVVGLILGIVGGVNASTSFQNTGTYQPGSLNKAGTSLFIVTYVGIVAATILISFSVSHAEKGEKRIIMAVAFSLPFLLVRLAYSIGSTFSYGKKFNLLTGNPTILLCVALLEEIIVVFAYEGTGLTLGKVVKIEHPEGARMIHGNSTEFSREENMQQAQKQEKPDNVVLKIAKRSIIGRIVMSFVPDNSDNGAVEMNRPRQHRQRRHERR
jgi:hypothetical protein